MFFFTDKEGNRIEYDTKSIVALHSNIASPSYEYLREVTDTGIPLILDRHLLPRQIQVEFLLKASDFDDTYLLRDELYRLLATQEELYFHESAVPYKRWKVTVEDSAMGEKGYNFSHYVLTLEAPLGLSESVASTLTKHTFDEDKWQFGQGLSFYSEEFISNKTEFTVENYGDVTVDPRIMGLEITFLGASTNLEIRNTTTGDKWSYKGKTTATDKIELRDIFAFKNGANIFKDTNKQIITLAKGVNKFQIRGTTGSITTKVDSLFYYY